MGSLIFADQVPGEDAVPVRRLREAGAILVGKTTTPEFGHKPLTDSPLFGATRNPWDLSRTAGGSSGGAAAAVATGQGPLALGTDGGGSIRLPASCCGIVGLKPTLGRVPHVHQSDLFSSTSYIGPMARSVAETAACFDALVGFDAGDPYSRPEPADDPRDVAVRGLRLGWLPRVGNRLVDPEVLASCEAAVRHLEGRGAHVETVDEDMSAFERTFLIGSRPGWPRASARTWRQFGDKVAVEPARVHRAGRAVVGGGLGERARPADRGLPPRERALPALRLPALADPVPARARRRPRPVRADHDRGRGSRHRSAAPGIPISGPSTSPATRRSRCRAAGPPTGCPSGCRSSGPGTETAASSRWPVTSSASARARARCPSTRRHVMPLSPKGFPVLLASTSTRRPCGPPATPRTPSAPS